MKTELKRGIKTPIPYYGGKQQMVRHILPLIPEHDLYTETFFGGGAIYFAKAPSDIEVINDLNGELINFYRVLQNRFPELKKKLMSTLHSRKQHRHAEVIYEHPELFDEVQRAWALWVLANQSFASRLNGAWGYDRTKNQSPKKLTNAKQRFDNGLKERLEQTQIESTDAIRVLKSRDKKTAFHYIDPPYFNSNCGHYSHYSREDFLRLLAACASLQGKFLMSSYPSAELSEAVTANGWHQVEYSKQISVHPGARGKKVEVLTANYPIFKTDKNGLPHPNGL